MPTPAGEQAAPAKVGRPPRISRAMIAEAAHELGLEGLTLKAVAAHLDVSIAALYHHVSGKDDLLRAAAEYSVEKAPLPSDRGQHWAVWLFEWACHNHDVFASQAGLLEEYVDGAIGIRQIAPNLDRIIGVLRERGFGALEAQEAFDLVVECSLGAVVLERRAASVGVERHGLRRELDAMLAGVPRGELVHLRALRAEVAAAPRRPFERHLLTALRGVAAGRGEDWGPIDAELQKAIRRRHR